MAVIDPKDVVRHFTSHHPNYVHRAEAFFATSPFFVFEHHSVNANLRDPGDLGSYFSVDGRITERSVSQPLEDEADIESLIKLSAIEF
ncbi:MAG: hypothetical protein M3N13_01960 [Candidatus Eremiobacteraeota bacterium]|nr:hypothetical protein [Candidatus Eremiobacteraeota bacterium]